MTESAETNPVNAVQAAQVSKNGRLVVFFVEALMIILLAYLIVVFIYKVSTPRPDFASAFQATNLTATRSIEKNAYDTIVTFDPFYRTTGLVAAQSDAPESALKITIAGLRVGQDGNGAAIIDVQGDGQKLVSLGDEITGGVTLSKVFSDRIEISRRGVRETVYMTKASDFVRPQALSVAEGSSSDTVPLSGVNFSDVMSRIRLEPSRDDANRRIEGFRVTEETPQSLLSSTSLEVGDVIKSVNGSRLSSFERMQELSEELQSATSISIEIERRGQLLTLTF